MINRPRRWLSEHVVGNGESAPLACVGVWVGAVAGEHVVDPLRSSGSDQVVACGVPGGVDRVAFSRCRWSGGEPVESSEFRLQMSYGVVRDRLTINDAEAAIFAFRCWGSGGGHGVDHGLHCCRLGCWPVGEGRLRGDQGVDLFEFDDVWPVGDDPVRRSFWARVAVSMAARSCSWTSVALAVPDVSWSMMRRWSGGAVASVRRARRGAPPAGMATVSA